MTAAVTPDLAVSRQGHYAGAVTRFAAYVVDQFAAGIAFSLGVSFFRFVVSTITRHDVHPSDHRLLVLVAYIVWLFVWFAYPWATSGKTLGMSILGLRVVTADGAPITPRQAVVRTVTLPVGFITLGIGFLGIIFGREHRAFHDRIAGTAVVYGWDAKATRYRFLARQADER